ncbi:MAG TPA: type I-B CRISPR-associated protein Cas7/Cst2/DevR [Planctomycetota bacterium]|nr:type I-B CRISPR-associated protein Cas7/Cst2/DevR [Planctomycetota bacterium]
MSVHVFGAIVTGNGTAANNRGLTEGNCTTLQKLVWNGQVHTTVSAESIRFALRRRLVEADEPCNRVYDEDTRASKWEDASFARWSEKSKEKPFTDDDLLGFMAAEGGKQDGDKGSAKVRRSVLEVTRAVSLTPWPGDVTFNAASPGATPSAQKRGSNPVPYSTEMHATRYQYGFALTPGRLRDPSRAKLALRMLCALGEVAGNHGRFLFDFSPESVIFRVSEEAAPRILYAFESTDRGAVSIADLVRKVNAGDIQPSELVLGGAIVAGLDAETSVALKGADLKDGVKAACEAVCVRLDGRRAR